jgi:hypothetical protein
VVILAVRTVLSSETLPTTTDPGMKSFVALKISEVGSLRGYSMGMTILPSICTAIGMVLHVDHLGQTSSSSFSSRIANLT